MGARATSVIRPPVTEVYIISIEGPDPSDVAAKAYTSFEGAQLGLVELLEQGFFSPESDTNEWEFVSFDLTEVGWCAYFDGWALTIVRLELVGDEA